MSKEDWSPSNLEAALEKGLREKPKNSDLTILIADENLGIFSGITRDNFLFFVGPQRNELREFSFPVAKLEKWKTFELPTGEQVGPSFLLSCSAENQEEIWTISSLFSGLHGLATDSITDGTLISSVQGLERYFRRKLKADFDGSIEVGLMGELILLSDASDIVLAVQGWHENARSTYDFGFSDLQIEVKTSTSPSRIHWLRSTQTHEEFNHRLVYVSLYCPEVPNGESVLTLVDKIRNRLDDSIKLVFDEKVNQYDISKFSGRYDVVLAGGDVRWIDGKDVPRPIYSDSAILEVNWKCSFIRLPAINSMGAWVR